MKDFIIGTCHAGRESYAALRDIGLNALRLDIPFPFGDRDRTPSDAFTATAEYVREVHAQGLQPVGITPYPIAVPDWEGPPGSDGYFSLARESARFLPEQFKDRVRVWESTNEMNIGGFRQPLDVDQAVRFVIESARGVKEADAGFKIGANMGGMDDLGKSMYKDIYAADVGWDYIGTDGYFGTWEEGGPHTWTETFDWLNELAPLPVFVMEWGFASKGDIMPRADVIPDGTNPHDKSLWCFGWDEGGQVLPHTFEMQGRFITEAMEIIAERAAGAFYYCWRDSSMCSCGKAECPVEANWGLVDVNGDPKPSYYALQKAIQDMG